MSSALRLFMDSLRRWPPVRAIRRRRFERVFRHAPNTHVFDGVFATFADAAAAAPATRPHGYDHPAAASMYRDRLDQALPEDAPLAAHLRSLAPLGAVVDFGGHVGLAWYAMRRWHGAAWAPASWTVVDVPAVLAEGRALAERRAAPIRFASALDGLDADVFVASGALQYVEPELPALLGRLRQLPRTVILHKTPLTRGAAYVTLNAIGTAFCPYVVRQRQAVFDGLAGLGYRLTAEWEAPAFRCEPWDRPDLAVQGYAGAAFERASA